MASQHSSTYKEKITHKQCLMFAVSTLQECFTTRARRLETLRSVKRELFLAFSKLSPGRAPRQTLTGQGITAAPLLTDGTSQEDAIQYLGKDSSLVGEQLMADRYVHRRIPRRNTKPQNNRSQRVRYLHLPPTVLLLG